jgi:hypothetical protein
MENIPIDLCDSDEDSVPATTAASTAADKKSNIFEEEDQDSSSSSSGDSYLWKAGNYDVSISNG